jgi:hypothetical protein
MPEILDAIRENGLALVALVLVSLALVAVVKAFHGELKDRIKRAEADADALGVLNDKLADNFRIALDELRKQ